MPASALSTSARAAARPACCAVPNGADLLRMLPPVPERQISLPSKWTTHVQHKFLNPQRAAARAPTRCAMSARRSPQWSPRTDIAPRTPPSWSTLDLEALPPVVDPEAPCARQRRSCMTRFATNVIGTVACAKAMLPPSSLRRADRFRHRFDNHRYSAMPMECRGVVAQYDSAQRPMTVWSATQVVHWVRREVASRLGLPEFACALHRPRGRRRLRRARAMSILKTCSFPTSRAELGRPVRWIEDRQ